MRKHIGALIVCTVASAIVSGIIGEALWPSGSYALIGSLFGFACMAGVAAPIVYVVVALARHDARMFRKEAGAEKRSAIRPIALTTCVVTIAVTFGLGWALRLGWIGR